MTKTNIFKELAPSDQPFLPMSALSGMHEITNCTMLLLTDNLDTKEMLLSRLEDLYSKFDQVLLCDRILFDRPIEEQRQYSNLQLDNLIRYLIPLIKTSMDRASKHGKQFKPIDRFFTTTRPQIPPDLMELLT